MSPRALNRIAFALAWMPVAAAMLLTSCANHNEISDFQRVGPNGWAYADTIVYEKPDTITANCDVALAVRNTNGYEYSNIWVELTYSPEVDSLARDTFNIQLADDIGRWLGTGIGVGFQKVDTVLRGVTIDLSQPVMLRHVMRADTLSGIEQTGIIIKVNR